MSSFKKCILFKILVEKQKNLMKETFIDVCAELKNQQWMWRYYRDWKLCEA